MRILGLDYGDKRIGVAVSDEMGITARGVATVVRKYWKRDIAQIMALAGEYDADLIVIGYPVKLDGTRGIQCEKVDGFVEALEEEAVVPVVRWNEALSTKEAEGFMREAAINPKKMRGIVDKVAASIILQSYLDQNPRGSASEDQETQGIKSQREK